MTQSEIYQAQSAKSLKSYLQDVSRLAESRGFLIHNAERMDMRQMFVEHGHPVPDDFDLHMIQLCKPEKASKSLSKNPDRAPLMPKFIMIFSKEGKTMIRLLTYGTDFVSGLLDDDEFPESLVQSFDALKTVIDEAC
ncbi:MAG: DUF302 domain-containing protein [Desulfuromonas sp.]|nr:MAG: DUF302 domain-containing protein [Desulfuromonas sp.]